MKKYTLLPLLLALSLLTGCGSLLERSYTAVTPHTQFSDESKNDAILRAETYQGLVSALLYLVEQGEETGTVRLYQYGSVTGTAASDVDQACLEVTQEDPLGEMCIRDSPGGWLLFCPRGLPGFPLTYRGKMD